MRALQVFGGTVLRGSLGALDGAVVFHVVAFPLQSETRARGHATATNRQ